MNRNFVSIAALLGALCVALGAFAAHKLRSIVGPDTVAIFETGVRYQFYHVFALLFVALLSEKMSNKWMIWAGNCFITGIILFSGSLYALKKNDPGDETVAGPDHPFIRHLFR